MRALASLLILSHRYLSVPISLMFVLWFVSGFFMIYTGGMPKVTPAMQLDGAEVLDFTQVKLTPAAAAELVGYEAPTAKLRTVLGRPVYEFGDPGYGSFFMYADTGEFLEPLTTVEGAELASSFLAVPVQQFRFVETLEDRTDQWTFTVRSDLPLHKYAVDDGLGTEVYVSSNSAVVSAYTTRQSRLLAWLGTIPHWLYFEGLRDNQPLWYRLVVWSATLGCVSALLGLLLGITQFRQVRPFNLQRAIPYRGLMRWHYVLGCLFGVVTLTWVFSGLVSMEPWDWTNARGVQVAPAALSQRDLELSAFPDPRAVDWQEQVPYPVKELAFVRVLGRPMLVAGFSSHSAALEAKRDRLHQPYNIAGQLAAETLVIDASTGRRQASFDSATLAEALDVAIDEARVTGYEVLDAYDDYYYSRGNQLPLPVLRVTFDDPAESWLYVDPVRGELLSVIHKYSRLERWLYSGLHSLDFAFWYHKRPLWDIGVLALLSGGLLLSLLGLYLSLKRIGQDLRQALARLTRGKRRRAVAPLT
jgi:hypothetical protein